MTHTTHSRGRGRPPTGETPKRYFRMSDADWALIEKAAANATESVSEYVRRVLLDDARRTPHEK
ncbi:MAG: hypothetical protein U0941_15810 [Planctomycetaceae bacterium]